MSKVGRPKKSNNRIYVVKVLLTEQEHKKISDYSIKTNISKSSILASFIKSL